MTTSLSNYNFIDLCINLINKKYLLKFLLGFEVNEPSKILIKILNVEEFIESDIVKFEEPRTNNLII